MDARSLSTSTHIVSLPRVWFVELETDTDVLFRSTDLLKTDEGGYDRKATERVVYTHSHVTRVTG